MRILLPLSFLLLTGCATSPAPTPDTVRMNMVVKERYWRMQAAQQTPPHRSVNVLQPARIEDGARRVPTVIHLDFP